MFRYKQWGGWHIVLGLETRKALTFHKYILRNEQLIVFCSEKQISKSRLLHMHFCFSLFFFFGLFASRIWIPSKRVAKSYQFFTVFGFSKSLQKKTSIVYLFIYLFLLRCNANKQSCKNDGSDEKEKKIWLNTNVTIFVIVSTS